MATCVWSRFARSGCRLGIRSYKKSLKRGYCSSQNDISSISLAQPVPGIPTPQYASLGQMKHESHVTVLENGLTVATENKFGHFCTVGVVIDSGSRYEVACPSGISHFLEKLAFSSTTQFENRDAILQELEKHGGICDCQGSRDTLIYAISAETKGLASVINILSEVVLHSNITHEELEDTRSAIGFELESLELNPNPEMLLMEMVHAAAFRDNTLGLPKFCPPENIETVDKLTLLRYLKNYHSPQRMVLAGVGMEHNVLVDLARQCFVEKKSPLWLEDGSVVDRSEQCDHSVSQYTGGMVHVEKDLSNVSLGPTPMPELAHFVIGLESCSHKDDDFVAFCVLNMMMGGGGSFSAGGPGKGMYTRLYLNVLNRYHWIHNATAYNHAYEDSGLFCIHSSAHPDQMKELVEVIVRELVNTSNQISTDELNRAKTQLQSMLLMNLESRPVVFEDLGRQVLANKERKQPEYFYHLIGEITEEDIKRVANRMLQSPPSVAAYGSLSKMPNFEDIQSALVSRDGRMPKRFSLFRN
ncbi:hypothetical protein ScPMuIL_011010 [Solemya velum]